MLNPEQRNEVANDLHHLQGELVSTYSSCQAAEQEAFYGLRQAIQNDPLLCNDAVAIECIDAIDEQNQQLQALSSTAESVDERRSRANSIQENLNILEERAQEINPNGPLAKVLKLFQRLFSSIAHTLSKRDQNGEISIRPLTTLSFFNIFNVRFSFHSSIK